MDPWSWTRQRGTFHFNFLPKIRRGSENSTFTAHNPATFSNEKRFFFPSRSLENREKFNVKKKKKKGKTIIILWPRRKIISSLDKSFVELENFQARHEVFFRQFGRSVNCLCSAYSFILFFSCIQSIYLLVFAIMKLAILFDWNLNFRLLLNLKLLWRIFW